MVPMIKRGAWWKALTDKNVEVSVSANLFTGIYERQLATHDARVLAGYEEPAIAEYGVPIACLSPQWWVDCFLDHDYAIGMQRHTWKRKPGYARLEFERDSRPLFDGPQATLIFRTRSPKTAQHERDSRSLKAAQAAVDDFFNKRTTSIARW